MPLPPSMIWSVTKCLYRPERTIPTSAPVRKIQIIRRFITRYPRRQRGRRTQGRTWGDAAGRRAPSRTCHTCTEELRQAWACRTRHRTCPYSPRRRCRSQPSAAAAGLGLPHSGQNFPVAVAPAGALPAVPGRLRLRLLAAAVGTEVAGDAALDRRCRSSPAPRERERLRRLLLGLLLLAHLEQVLGVHAAHLAGHAHAHKGHGGTGAGVGGRRLHRLALRARRDAPPRGWGP